MFAVIHQFPVACFDSASIRDHWSDNFIYLLLHETMWSETGKSDSDSLKKWLCITFIQRWFASTFQHRNSLIILNQSCTPHSQVCWNN